MKSEVKTFKIRRVFVEGTQRGFVVGIVDSTGKRGDLKSFPCGTSSASIDEAYRAASLTATSIEKHGRWVGSRKGWSLHVRGKTLTATRFV